MKNLIFLVAFLTSFCLHSQSDTIIKQVFKQKIEVGAGISFLKISEDDYDKTLFFKIGVSNKKASPIGYYMGLAIQKRGYRDTQFTFLQQEIAITLENSTPIGVKIGGFLGSSLNKLEVKDVKIRGFEAGPIASLCLKFPHVGVSADYLHGLMYLKTRCFRLSIFGIF